MTQSYTDGLLAVLPDMANALGKALGISGEQIQVLCCTWLLQHRHGRTATIQTPALHRLELQSLHSIATHSLVTQASSRYDQYSCGSPKR